MCYNLEIEDLSDEARDVDMRNGNNQYTRQDDTVINN